MHRASQWFHRSKTDLFRVIEQETKKVYPNSITLPHLVIYGTDFSVFSDPKGQSVTASSPVPVTMEEYSTIHGNDETGARREH